MIGDKFEAVSYSDMESNIGEIPSRDEYPSEDDYKQAWKDYTKRQNEYKWYRHDHELTCLFANYWDVDMDYCRYSNVPELYKTNPKWIEVLCESAQIIRKISEPRSELLQVNDKVEFLVDYVNKYYSGYKKDGATKASESEMQRIIRDFNGKKTGTNNYELTIPKGTKAIVDSVFFRPLSPKQFKSDVDAWHNDGEYNRLTVSPEGYDFPIYLHNTRHTYPIRTTIKRIE